MKHEKGQHGEPWVMYSNHICSDNNELLMTPNVYSERVISCVNALDGMDPADVAKMKAVVDAARVSVRNQIRRKQRGYGGHQCDEKCMCDVCRIKRALDALDGEG
jgi:hypothetical protein